MIWVNEFLPILILLAVELTDLSNLVVAAGQGSDGRQSISVDLPSTMSRRFVDEDDAQEFNLFDNRPPTSAPTSASFRPSTSSASTRRSSSYFPKAARTSSQSPDGKPFLEQVQDWWSTNFPNLPRINTRTEPTMTLKIRKTFRPLKTIVRLGADYNVQLGVWQFQSSWEDAVLGAKLRLAGRELQVARSWDVPMGVPDMVARVRLRAAVDLQTMKRYFKIGLRTERLLPINTMMGGFTVRPILPLDGNDGNMKLEMQVHMKVPQPEIEFGNQKHRNVQVGMGDFEVDLEEFNIILDY